ncbi:6828_t:CDS:1, partial [Dentiscutata erythropus]
AVREPGAVQEQLIGFEGSSFRMVGELLKRAAYLKNKSISEEYRRRLAKAQGVFNVSLVGLGVPPYPASSELLVAFLAWLELSKKTAEIAMYLAAVAREHKVRGFEDSTKSNLVRFVVEGIRSTMA